MQSFTFDVIQRDKNQNNLCDLFSKSVVDIPIYKYEDIVQDGEECRLDLVCFRLYGTTKYVEELMTINNILNPFSICSGDVIYYVSEDSIEVLDQIDKPEVNSDKVANPKNKNTRTDPSRQTGVAPTIRPLDFEQLIVDKKNKTIKLNTKLS